MNNVNHSSHGSRCSCQVLASTVGCDSGAILFGFCRAVLMKRWIIECNHGCLGAEVEIQRDDKWHGVGPIDSVKAILIKNE